MKIQPSDIPAPRPDDQEYMKVWRKSLQTSIDNYGIERERNAWRTAFYIVAAILFAMLFVMVTLCGSKFFTPFPSDARLPVAFHSSLFT